MGMLAGELAWRGALLLGYQSRELKRIWDGLTNVRAHPGWGLPVFRMPVEPLNVVAALPQDCESLPSRRAPDGSTAQRMRLLFGLTSLKVEDHSSGQHPNAHYVAGRRLIIRVAGIRPWCHFLRTHTPLETHEWLAVALSDLEALDDFGAGLFCPVPYSIPMPAAGPDIISDSALRRGEPRITGTQALRLRVTVPVTRSGGGLNVDDTSNLHRRPSLGLQLRFTSSPDPRDPSPATV